MASEEDISRIAKILARATSAEPHEANAALHAAYKRMRRDQVGIRQLLTLPLDELYQEALVKLISVLLEHQSDLSPAERRKAFENYMAMITARFSKQDYSDLGSSASSQREEEELQRAEEVKRHQEKMKEEFLREQQEQLKRKARSNAEAAKNTHADDRSRRPDATEMGGRSPQPSAQPGQSAQIWVTVGALSLLCVAIWSVSTQQANNNAAPVTAPSQLPVPVKTELQNVVVTTHSVAALNANLRAEPTAQSRLKTTLKRGYSFELISTRSSFLEVRLPNGETGFIAQELVIPSKDLTRLLKLTAREYVAARLSEKRIDELVLQTEKQKTPFVAVLFGLTNRSNSIDKYLEELRAAKALSIEADGPASIWFALNASATMKAADYESSYWEARAAIEADPANADHHVAFALANYQLGNYESVKAIGRILPRLAPTSTNAWMLFALANSFDSESNDELTKAAFVLAIKLSRNAGNTKKYFQDFAAKTPVPRIKELVNSALAEEMSNPELFANAATLRTALKNP